MLEQDQILQSLKRLDEGDNFSSLKKNIIDYFTSFRIDSDELFDILRKGIRRGYAKETARLLSEITEEYSFPQLYTLLAEAYEKSAQYEKAAKVFIKLSELAPRESVYLLSAAENFQNAGMYVEAINLYEKVYAKDKNNAVAVFNLGACFRKLNDWDNAAKFFEQYIKIKPEDEKGFYNLAVIYEKEFRFVEAEKLYRKALSLNNNFPDAHWNLALILLRERKYDEGWAEFEWRKRMPFYKKNNLDVEEWKGENLKGKKVLIYSEQGFGDMIQFVRFIHNLKEQSPQLVAVFVPDAITRLFNSMQIFDLITSDYEEIEDVKFDYKVSFLSIPFLLNIANDKIQLTGPLFNIAHAKDISDDDVLKIGIVWKGNPEHENSRYRDLELKDLLEMFSQIEKVEIHSLQKGEISKEEEELLYKDDVINHYNQIDDFFDTAEIIASLDVVISVDTAALHLSGSMMKETWGLIPKNSDWRWGDNITRSDWYPTVEIFKQSKLGDWAALLNDIRERLLRKINYGGFAERRDKLEAEGSAYFNSGKYEEAIRLFTEVAEKYRDARAYNNLGIVFRSAGKVDEGILNFKKAIEHDEKYFEAYRGLVSLLIDLGKFDEAHRVLNSARQFFADDYELIYLTAILFHKENRLEEAYENYLKIYPNYQNVNYLLDFATLLLEEKKTKFADKVLTENNKILNLDKRYYFLRGNLHKENEEFEEAIKRYEAALSIDPKYFDAKINLALVKFLLYRIDEAKELYIELLSEKEEANIFYNLGIIEQEKKNYDESLMRFQKAIELKPKPEYYFAMAEIFLSMKNFEIGLPLYEKRLEFMNVFFKPKMPSCWEEMDGRKILVFEEQGIGDTFQFVRFINAVNETAEVITLAVRPKMKNFWESVNIADNVVPLEETNIKDYDFVIPIVSLFYLWHNKFRTFPRNKKYLTVEKSALRDEINPRKKIALAWRGNPNPVHHRKRHMKLENLLPLINSVDADFYILQNELNAEEETIVINYSNLIFEKDVVSDWNKLSELVACSDLVLTIDTVYAHLAGALGKEVFLMLPYSADWRWGIDDSLSYWYDKMRLFRQSRINDWDSVIKDIIMNIDSKIK